MAGLPERRRYQGTIRPGGPDWVYLPVEVPAGVGELAVRYRYDRPATPPGVAGNTLDLGVLDQKGAVRGWSGGARDGFSISAAGATPGYLPGPVGRGTWQVVLGPYTVAPQGLAWEVEVTLGEGPPEPAFRADPAPERAAGRGRGWYRGDLHTHTVHSDGRRTPAELAAAARAAGLDFIASTEHNTTSANLGWGANAGPDLLVLDGQEVTTRDGHWLALGLGPGPVVEWRYRAADGGLGRALAGLHERGGLAVAAHPFCPLPGCAWGFGYDGVDAVEIWNGPWTPDDEATLGAWDRMLAGEAAGGRFLPAVAGSDSHTTGDRVGLPHNVVLADGLDRRSILDALAAGRCWLAGSASVDLRLEAAAGGRSAGIGERLAVPAGQEVAVRLQARGAAGGLARLCGPGGPVLEAALGAGDPETVEWRTTATSGAWVRVEIRRDPAGPMLALTNPVWFGPAAS
jgi:hypothetical protein